MRLFFCVGLVFLSSSVVVTAEEHWAFQPPTRPDVPNVRTGSRPTSPIDAFILARLEEKGLRPTPSADPRTLIRRVTFDLTGLPPTPEDVNRFVADTSPDAFVRLTDRLLASPAYGERWGRHWLDVARYADSNGMDENIVQANAWRYRDYVIDAFNRDVPYDRFVRQQIAGDLLPDAERSIVATGFLSLGPKMLAEDDPVKMQMDIIDEQLNTIGQTFLGVTIGCARCHDHKFDPVSIREYYALAGIFKSTQTMDNFKVVAKWHERPLTSPDLEARIRKHDEAIRKAEAGIEQLRAQAREKILVRERPKAEQYAKAARQILAEEKRWAKIKPNLDDTKQLPEGSILIEAEDFTRGNLRKEHTGYGEGIGVIYNAGQLPNVAEYDIPVKKAGSYRIGIRYAAAQARPVSLSINGKQIRSDAAGEVTGSWYPKSQQWAIEAIVQLSEGKNVLRLERAGPFPHIDKLVLVPSADDEAAHVPMTVEQIASKLDLIPTLLLAWAEHLRNNQPASADPFAKAGDLSSAFSAETTRSLTQQRADLKALKESRPATPNVMAVDEGTVTDLQVHLRGSHLTLGDVAPRQFPVSLTTTPAPVIPKDQSGRSQLAEWIVHPDHSLSSRVMANRIWHWHFGRGLCRTPDNFGKLGEAPTHPQLLDWLSREFVESGWSIKSLHRTIVLSGVYQMASTFDEAANEADPENLTYWRWQRRRLEAESIRDGLLAVTSRLDRTMGGTLFEGENRKYVPGYPNTSYDRYGTPRRSVYLPVLRSDLYTPFQAFDFADPSTPSGCRSRTTVAPQALFMMNGKLVQEAAERLARRLLERSEWTNTDRVQELYMLAYGRPAEAAEVSRALKFLSAATSLSSDDQELTAWRGLVRVIFSSNEFVYLD